MAQVKNMSADPRKASAIIGHISKPGNEGISNKQAARDLGTNEAYIRRAKTVFDYGNTTKLDPNIIRRDGSTQPRANIANDVVADYSELLTGGTILPPVRVYYDGSNYWLADGFHRVLAALHARRKVVEAVVMMGGQRDAILCSVGANNDHGLRRTNEDKRRSVTTLLMDPEWGQWSDRSIAERCKVSQPFVSGVREQLGTDNGYKYDAPRSYTRNGKKKTMNVTGIGRRSPETPDPAPHVHEVPSRKAEPDDRPAPDTQPPTISEPPIARPAPEPSRVSFPIGFGVTTIHVPNDPERAGRMLAQHFTAEQFGRLAAAFRESIPTRQGVPPCH